MKDAPRFAYTVRQAAKRPADIARTERGDPMIAAQKLRDFAISYGAEGTTMIMVISEQPRLRLTITLKPTLKYSIRKVLMNYLHDNHGTMLSN